MSLAKSIVARRLGLTTGPTVISVTRSPPRRKPPALKPAPRPSEPDVLDLPPPRTPTPPPPPPVIAPGWKGSCQAVCAVTGRRCRLPAHRMDEPHRHERGQFTFTAAPGQTSFAARSELEREASARHLNPIHLTP